MLSIGDRDISPVRKQQVTRVSNVEEDGERRKGRTYRKAARESPRVQRKETCVFVWESVVYEVTERNALGG